VFGDQHRGEGGGLAQIRKNAGPLQRFERRGDCGFRDMLIPAAAARAARSAFMVMLTVLRRAARS